MAGTRPRRTQAERSDETRARVLEAAIGCLHRHGYAAATTLLVAREAGVSRGAMLHQFPTKVDLMLYVVRAVYDREVAEYVTRLRPVQDLREQLLAMPEMVWDVLSRPSGVAVLEILQGSRSDPQLAERLLPLQDAIEIDALAWTARFDAVFGAPVAQDLIRVIVWSIRGLSVAQTLEGDSDLRKSVRLLRDMIAVAMPPVQGGETPLAARSAASSLARQGSASPTKAPSGRTMSRRSPAAS